jgi:hypothetical protein
MSDLDDLRRMYVRCQDLLDDAEVPCASGLDERLELVLADYKRLLAERRRDRPERERLLEMLDEDPSEILMLLADACLDEGKTAEAMGWGWLAQAGKWPTHTRSGWLWYVYLSQTDLHSGDSDYLSSVLVPIQQDHAGDSITSSVYPSARAALEAVVSLIVSSGGIAREG